MVQTKNKISKNLITAGVFSTVFMLTPLGSMGFIGTFIVWFLAGYIKDSAIDKLKNKY